MDNIVLSHFQAEHLLAARRVGHASARVSLDLELTTADVILEDNGVRFPNGESLTWQRPGDYSGL